MKIGTIKDIEEDFSRVVNKTCCGECSNCGECCSDILPIDEYEIATIKKYIATYNIKECRHTTILENVLDLTCPFRDNINKKCTIYKVRPSICKHFICSKPMPDVERDKELFYRQKQAVSMRNVFFNGKPLFEILLELQIGRLNHE